MAQALKIKTANTVMKTVGDIVGIYEDTFKFDPHELREKGFDVGKIEGTREEVVEKLNAIHILLSTAYKAATTEWTQTRPERKTVWFDTDGKWYFFDAPPKYKWSMALLEEAEKTTLETATTGLERDTIYQKMIVNPGVWDDKNKIEVTALNQIAVEL